MRRFRSRLVVCRLSGALWRVRIAAVLSGSRVLRTVAEVVGVRDVLGVVGSIGAFRSVLVLCLAGRRRTLLSILAFGGILVLGQELALLRVLASRILSLLGILAGILALSVGILSVVALGVVALGIRVLRILALLSVVALGILALGVVALLGVFTLRIVALLGILALVVGAVLSIVALSVVALRIVALLSIFALSIFALSIIALLSIFALSIFALSIVTLLGILALSIVTLLSIVALVVGAILRILALGVLVLRLLALGIRIRRLLALRLVLLVRRWRTGLAFLTPGLVKFRLVLRRVQETIVGTLLLVVPVIVLARTLCVPVAGVLVVVRICGVLLADVDTEALHRPLLTLRLFVRIPVIVPLVLALLGTAIRAVLVVLRVVQVLVVLRIVDEPLVFRLCIRALLCVDALVILRIRGVVHIPLLGRRRAIRIVLPGLVLVALLVPGGLRVVRGAVLLRRSVHGRLAHRRIQAGVLCMFVQRLEPSGRLGHAERIAARRFAKQRRRCGHARLRLVSRRRCRCPRRRSCHLLRRAY